MAWACPSDPARSRVSDMSSQYAKASLRKFNRLAEGNSPTKARRVRPDMRIRFTSGYATRRNGSIPASNVRETIHVQDLTAGISFALEAQVNG